MKLPNGFNAFGSSIVSTLLAAGPSFLRSVFAVALWPSLV